MDSRVLCFPEFVSPVNDGESGELLGGGDGNVEGGGMMIPGGDGALSPGVLILHSFVSFHSAFISGGPSTIPFQVICTLLFSKEYTECGFSLIKISNNCWSCQVQKLKVR